ncbi:triple tyrosine motif-containing protein [Lutibacter maritimus]|uniref:triple tyrosine motif-containing protein n=1 Tax=Lutibacter maritimus TaxID=593133 RepID=UPI001C43245E|nr:triple tyrosine motif-containing protein [Lutibacter maritimus]
MKPNILRNTPLKEHFDSNDYKGGIQNWAFDQTSDGILYIANNEGLLEFDGREWNKYEVPLATRLRALKVDSQDRIFVGGQGQIGYFTKTKNDLVFTSLLKYLPKNKQDIAETWKILELNGKIIFNTESELFVFENNNLKAMTLPGYMRYAFNIENKVFAQFYGKGLYEFINNEFIPIKGTEIGYDIIAILPTNKGYYCLTREGEMKLLDNKGYTPIDLKVNLGTVNAAIKLTSGEYVVGTQSNGIFIFNSNFTLKNHLTKKEGLSDRTVKSLYEDAFHNLWVGLNNGIDYLKINLPFSLINEEVGIEGTGYAAIRHDNEIYLGTNTGVFIQKKEKNNLDGYPFTIITGSEGQVYNFSEVENKLILNHDRGAFELKGKNLTQIQDIGSWKFMNTKIPNLVVGGDYRGISIFNKNNDNWSVVQRVEKLEEQSSRIMEFENDSTLWMTHVSKGAFRIEFNSNLTIQKNTQKFGKKDGLPSNIMIDVYSLNNNLVFTTEKGIYDFNSNTRTFSPNLHFKKWLGTGYVSTMVSNENNAIYYIQNKKFGNLVQKGFGTFENKTHIFKHINKFISDDLANITILDENNVLIGAKEGFINYTPNKKPFINENFHVLLRKVETQTSIDSINTYNPAYTDQIEITEKHSIKFHYAAPYFDGFEDLKYSYRLVPLDEQWSKWSSLGEKEFTHLPFGKYTLEIKAKNIYEIESNVSTFSFEVLTPWYFTNWAKMSYLILAIIFLFLIPIIQQKKYRKEKSIIYKNKDEEIKIKDKEINKLENEKLKTEINLKNDQLTTITMHLVKNNDFIQDVQNKIISSLDQTDSKKELKKIIKTIDSELSNNDSWDQFAYHFDQVHGNYLKKLSENNIKLSPREIKLAAFLRMNMSSKEISKMLNITSRGVELARYRLRKKLKLKRAQNLVEYLIDLDNS